MKKLSILLAFASILVVLPSCKKGTEPQPEQMNETAQALEDAKPAEDVKPTDDADTKGCPANPNDPDRLYRDFFDCSTPYPMMDGKAAKYSKSWKADEEHEMNGYEFKEISQTFIDDYKKALEAAGFANDRPAEAPPIYQKRIDKMQMLRVDLTDTFCKEWVDDCDHNQKTGDLIIQTKIMEYEEPAVPEPEKPSATEEEAKKAYNNPADPDKLYVGLPKPCIFPMKDGKAFEYDSKTDIFDKYAQEEGRLTYTYGSTKDLDIEDFIGKTFGKQLKEAGFNDDWNKETKDGYCGYDYEAGEGELMLRVYIRKPNP